MLTAHQRAILLMIIVLALWRDAGVVMRHPDEARGVESSGPGMAWI